MFIDQGEGEGVRVRFAGCFGQKIRRVVQKPGGKSWNKHVGASEALVAAPPLSAHRMFFLFSKVCSTREIEQSATTLTNYDLNKTKTRHRRRDYGRNETRVRGRLGVVLSPPRRDCFVPRGWSSMVEASRGESAARTPRRSRADQ